MFPDKTRKVTNLGLLLFCLLSIVWYWNTWWHQLPINCMDIRIGNQSTTTLANHHRNATVVKMNAWINWQRTRWNEQGEGYLHKCRILLTAVEFATIILLLAGLLRLKLDSNCYCTKAGHTTKCSRLRAWPYRCTSVTIGCLIRFLTWYIAIGW